MCPIQPLVNSVLKASVLILLSFFFISTLCFFISHRKDHSVSGLLLLKDITETSSSMIHTAKCLFYIQLSELLGLGLNYTWLYYPWLYLVMV